MDLRGWVNSGLMSFFFLVVGLEHAGSSTSASFESVRESSFPCSWSSAGWWERSGSTWPSMLVRTSAHGWGVSMSTDTAFTLGLLALLGRHAPERLRGFILTLTVVDDIVGLVAIATVYTHHLTVAPLVIAIRNRSAACGPRSIASDPLRIALLSHWPRRLVSCWSNRRRPGRRGACSGPHCICRSASPQRPRTDPSDLFRDFREQPTAGMAKQLRAGVRTAVSPNERLQQIWHPWTSFLIVPLFGSRDAGIPIHIAFLAQAYTSPITLGIVVGYVVGKPAGIMTVSALVNKVTRGRLRPPVGWVAALGGGTLAGMGFTVSLLVASVAFTGVGVERGDARSAHRGRGCSGLFTWLVFQIANRLPAPLRSRALLGQSPAIVDLADPVDGRP